MDSKYPPAENNSADSSRSSLLPPHDGGRDNANPAKATTTKDDNQSEKSGTKSVESSTTNAANHTMGVVSGRPKDIICGRGLHVMSHHGNHNLHLIVDRYRQAYKTSTRKEKAAITQRIVQELKSTGARFLRRFNDDGDEKWVEVDDETAYKKVGHALRLRKGDHGQHFLKSLHGQPRDNQQPVALQSTPRTETNTSQNVAAAAMPSGPQNPMSHLSRLSPSSSSLAMQLPTPSLQHQIQIAIQSQAASQPGVGIQPRPILSPSVISGYRNLVIDPRLYSQVFTNTLALMTQMQHQQRQSSNGSSADLQSSKKSPSEESRESR